MRLLRTDTSFVDVGKIKSFTLDLEYGQPTSDDDKSVNTFKLKVPYEVDLPKNSLIYVPESEWGGLVREPTVRREDGVVYRIYQGPSWHGILSQHLIRPNAGQDHLVVSGTAHDLIAMLINRIGIGGLFEAGEGNYNIRNYQFDRYCTVYEGMRKMLRSVGAKLQIRRGPEGKTVLSAVPAKDYIDDNKGSLYGFKMSQLHPVNHLCCLGEGELKDRIVIDLYADAQGRVSQTKSIFGIDEIEQRYRYNNADYDALLDAGTDRLLEMQKFTDTMLYLPEGGDYDVDDVVGISDYKTGVTITSRIERLIVTCGRSSPVPTVSYEMGDVEAVERLEIK